MFVAVGTSITVRLGVWSDLFFYECFAAMFICYAAHWGTYCSGSLHIGKSVPFSLLTYYTNLLMGCKLVEPRVNNSDSI